MSKSINLMRPSDANTRVHQSLKRRQKQEARFRSYGLLAIGIALLFLAVLFVSIFSKGIPGFFQHYVSLDLYVDQERIDPSGDCLLYTSPSPRDRQKSRMPSCA